MFRVHSYPLTALLVLAMSTFGCSSNGAGDGDNEVGGGAGGAGGAGGMAGVDGNGGAGGVGEQPMGGTGGGFDGRGAGGSNAPDYGEYPTYEGLELPADKGAVAGRIVNAAGAPLENLPILCCSLSICLTGVTDADGVYFITDIDADDSYKMQVTDRNSTYTSLIYYQPLVGGELSLLAEDLVLPEMRSAMVEWAAETGGSVTLADGAVTLTAGAGELEYPLGIDEMIQADRIAGVDLPPYPSTPWEDDAASVFGFLFNPVHVHSSGTINFEITDDAVGEAGTVWRVWSLEPDTGILEDVGTATVNDAGALASDEGSTLHHVTTIIFVPEAAQ